jgi:hypothetical protein
MLRVRHPTFCRRPDNEMCLKIFRGAARKAFGAKGERPRRRDIAKAKKKKKIR